MNNQNSHHELDEKIKQTIRKQFGIVALVTIGIAMVAIGGGYIVDMQKGTRPMYMLIGLMISAPITVWVNFSIIKRKLASINDEIEQHKVDADL
ncbi:MAG: hypothetical protein GYA18_08700 [Chloroflexi bacterium]|nr:hypothetical protein [Chloroflexota bacterium]